MTPEEMNYEALDPGIREIVRTLNDAGFDTCDSGDGVSKPADWYASGCAIPYPHVWSEVAPDAMIPESHRLADLLGPTWQIEVSYDPANRKALLLASQAPASAFAQFTTDVHVLPAPPEAGR